MPTIAELIGELESKKVTLRGREVALHAVPISIVSLIEAVYPRPYPPVEPDPNAGTGSGRFVKNAADPKYTQAFAEWSEKVVLIEIAASMDLQPDSSLPSGLSIKDTSVMRQWGEAAYAQLAKTLTPIERNMLSKAVDSISLGKAEEAAKKD